MLDDPRRSTIEKAGGPAQPQIFLTFDNMRAMRRECVFPRLECSRGSSGGSAGRRAEVAREPRRSPGPRRRTAAPLQASHGPREEPHLDDQEHGQGVR